MAFLTTTGFANILTVAYNREKYIAPHERFMTPFYDSVEDFADGGKPLGRQRSFFVQTGNSHSYSYVAESGNYADYTASTGLEAYVVAKEIEATLKMSTLMQLSGQGEGMMVQSDIIDQQVKSTTQDLMTALDLFTLANDAGRIAVVDATVATSSTFTAALPQSVFMLRKNQLLDFYTGSSVGEQGKKVGYVNYSTRLVTFASGVTLNATAGDGVYIQNSYGTGIFGLRAIVDDGTDAGTTIFGITRSTSPEVNATLINPGDGLQTYSEELVRQGCVTAKMQVGVAPDAMWCNEGVVAAHFASLTGNRVFTVGNGDSGVPKYRGGGNVDQAGVYFDGKLIPFKVDNNLPARELSLVHTPYFRRHVLKPPNWLGDNIGPEGAASPFFLQSPASSGQGYASAKIAGMNAFLNIANLQPRSCVRITGIADTLLAGD